MNKPFSNSQIIQYIEKNNIKGCIVECGVHEGQQEVLFIEELNKINEKRNIYMYDTFTGMVQPTNKDFTLDTTVLYHADKDQTFNYWKFNETDDHNNWCYCSIENVKQNLENNYDNSYLHYIKGMTCDTVHNHTEKIAVLRLDTDWYESSRYEINNLYKFVVPGGIIIIDDYYHWAGQKQAIDEFLLENNINIEMFRHDEKTSYFFKPFPV